MLGILALIRAEEDARNEKRRVQMSWKRRLCDTSDPFMMSDEIFLHRYRIYQVIQLIEMLRPRLNDDERGVPPHLQVLAILRFLAEGSYLKGVALDAYHPMPTTFSRYLHQVIPAILQFSHSFIRFPMTREEREVVQQGMEIPNLPEEIIPNDHVVEDENEHQLGLQLRQEIINNFFAN